MATTATYAVPRVPLSSITRAEFRKRFLEPNLPVILTGATADWRASREWVDGEGRPAFGTLVRLCGADEVVSVHDARGRGREMALSEYVAWWDARPPPPVAGAVEQQELLYLKDWHVAQRHPEYGAYETPACLGEDWLNEHWAAEAEPGDEGGDHRFVYVGPKGSKTALHADVFFSCERRAFSLSPAPCSLNGMARGRYSWSANVLGRKRWRLVPDAQRSAVSDAATQPRARSLAAIEAPGLTVHELVQEAGELLFVPSGWCRRRALFIWRRVRRQPTFDAARSLCF
jgi:hypothetical protein